MMTSTQDLLDTSVGQLRTLTAFLDEQLCQRTGGSDRATSATNACNEILQSLRGLIWRIQSTRPAPWTAHHPLPDLPDPSPGRWGSGVPPLGSPGTR
jgi:hypothetical protein